VLSALSRQDLSERDQQASRESYQAFKQVVDGFPQSRYATDAKQRMDYIVNALAEYELHVARYYFRRGAFVAAVNRAQQVLLEFQGAPATEEALYILVAGYEDVAGVEGELAQQRVPARRHSPGQQVLVAVMVKRLGRGRAAARRLPLPRAAGASVSLSQFPQPIERF
jgi:outer membrane assembly lipoprotein YfiO